MLHQPAVTFHKINTKIETTQRWKQHTDSQKAYCHFPDQPRVIFLYHTLNHGPQAPQLFGAPVSRCPCHPCSLQQFERNIYRRPETYKKCNLFNLNHFARGAVGIRLECVVQHAVNIHHSPLDRECIVTFGKTAFLGIYHAA